MFIAEQPEGLTTARIRANAESLYKGRHGWYSRREILTIETQQLCRIFDGPLDGSVIQGYARYTHGPAGWKNYITDNMHELNAPQWRHANAATEQAYALFEGIDDKHKNEAADSWASDSKYQYQWHKIGNGEMRFMETASVLHHRQYLLFLVMGQVPQKPLPSGEPAVTAKEDSIIVLRSKKPFDLYNHPEKIAALQEARSIALVAYKSNAEHLPIIFETDVVLPIHKVGGGRIWLSDKLINRNPATQLSDEIKQNEIKYLTEALEKVFIANMEIRLKGIQESTLEDFSPQDCARALWSTARLGAPGMDATIEKFFTMENLMDFYRDYVAMGKFYEQTLFVRNQLTDLQEEVSVYASAEDMLDALIEKQNKNIADKSAKHGEDYHNDVDKYALEFLEEVRRVFRQEEVLVVPSDVVVVDEDISDTTLRQYRVQGVVGIIDLHSKETAHAALEAKDSQFPFCLSNAELLRYLDRSDHDLPASEVLFYGGRIIINPTAAHKEEFQKAAEKDSGEFWLKQFIKQGSRPPALDYEQGRRPIQLANNFFLPRDWQNTEFSISSRMIGLIRMEMLRNYDGSLLDKAGKINVLQKAAQYSPLGVITRTLDLNHYDKKPESVGLPRFSSETETQHEYITKHREARKKIFDEVEAVYAAAKNNPAVPFSLMFPDISTVGELDYYIQNFVKPAQAKYPGVQVRLGAMIETAGAVFALDGILSRVDFISIGTNDLTMSILGEKTRQDTVQGLERSVLNAIQQSITTANRAGKSVEICGDMASNPLLACILVALGPAGLSMDDNSVPLVDYTLRYMDKHKLLPKIRELLDLSWSANFVADLYAQTLELFKGDEQLYDYLARNYPLPKTINQTLPPSSDADGSSF